MKSFAASLVLFVLCACAFAQSPVKAHAPKGKVIHCAVEKDNVVDVKEATAAGLFADYKGRRYYFCCTGCPQEFKHNPAKFAKSADSLPIPKATKKSKKA